MTIQKLENGQLEHTCPRYLATYTAIRRQQTPREIWEVTAAPYSLRFTIELECKSPATEVRWLENDVVFSILCVLEDIDRGDECVSQYSEDTWRAVHLIREYREHINDDAASRDTKESFNRRRQFMIAWIDKVVDYLDADTIRLALEDVDHIEVT